MSGAPQESAWPGYRREDPADWLLSKRLFQKLPDCLSDDVKHAFDSIREADSLRRATLFLVDTIESLPTKTLKLGADEDAIAEHARGRAALVQSLLRFASPAKVIGRAILIARQDAIEIDAIVSCVHTDLGLIGRFLDESWWRRNLRKTHGRHYEQLMRSRGKVHEHAGKFVSDDGLKRYRQQRRRGRALIEAMMAVNECGEEFPLEELVDASLANPRVRRSELMARIAGFDKLSQALGHSAEFYTLTVPSRMHARLGKSGARNAKYVGATPRDAQGYLCQVWTRIRAKLHRETLRPYGFRIAEPHHDGTPHWHFLLFMPASDTIRVREILAHYALASDGDEPGAKQHRFKAIAIDRSKGSATGYVAKYVAKSIDGHGLPETASGESPGAIAERVKAYASIWGFRQFQQIGGPCVGIYRELRRLGAAPEALEALRAAADDGDWAEFVRILGGPSIPRRALPVQLFTAPQEGVNRYGEPLPDAVKGIACGNLRVPTRIHTWTLRMKPPKSRGHDPP